MTKISLHSLADVHTNSIGSGTKVWQYCVILAGAQIGRECNICAHCFIENDVVVGDRVTVKCGVQLWDGITLQDDVFIGPNVTFTNDRRPRSRVEPLYWEKTYIQQGASVGANATLLPGVTVGRFSMVAAGSVVTRNVTDFSLVCGNPARHVGWVCRCGRALQDAVGPVICECGAGFALFGNAMQEIDRENA